MNRRSFIGRTIGVFLGGVGLSVFKGVPEKDTISTSNLTGMSNGAEHVIIFSGNNQQEMLANGWEPIIDDGRHVSEAGCLMWKRQI